MAFVLTLIYIAFALLSPGILPAAIVSLHVNEILGGLTILAALVSIPESRIWTLPDTYFVFGVLIASVLSTIASGWVGGAVATFTSFIPIIFTFYFVVIACCSVRRLNVLVVVLFFVALFVLLRGAIALRTGDFTSLYLEPEDVSGNMLYRIRGLGVLSDPNDLAQFFVMLIPLLWLRWRKGQVLSNFLFTLLPAAILAFGIYLTHSRGAVVALMAVMLFGFKDKLGLIKSSLLSGAALIALLALNISGGRGMNEDDGGRVAAWALGLQTFRSHPLFGVGMGLFGDYNDTGLTAHNSYVLCLAELGLFGYFFWIGMIVSGWTGLTAVIRQGRSEATKPEGDVSSSGSELPGKDALAMPWLRSAQSENPSEMGAQQMALVAVPSGEMLRAVPAREGATHSWKDIEEDEGDPVAERSARLVYSAKVIRISFVGFLTAAFFLSRTYSMSLYILLGMATAMKSINREAYPDVTYLVLPLLKRTGIVIVLSVVFLYLFVRLHGVS